MAEQFYLRKNPLSRTELGKSKEVSIITDNNPDLKYEKERLIYFLTTPVILLLTFWVALKKKILGSKLKINTFWADGISSVCRELKENAQGWRALDILYNYEFGEIKGFEGKITDFWLKTPNAQAMRNRLKLLKQCLQEELEKLFEKTSDVRLISVASGSAQGIIDVIQKFKQKGLSIKVILLDLDLSALEHSKILAKKAGVIEQIKFVNKNARELEEVVKDFNPQIIEVVGFLEYRPQGRAIELARRIYNLLGQGGVFLTSSISPNFESLFLRYVANWPMIYRNLKQFKEMLIKGGFKDFKIVYEPLKIQKIAICRKSG